MNIAKESRSVNLIGDLRDRLLTSLQRAIPSAARVALLDFPAHPNVGDSAIWAGERRALRDLGYSVVSVSAQAYSAQAVCRAIGPDGVVLLHGGGNLGDLWLTHQSLRERVLAEFPDHPVVQLPQTGNFSGDAALDSFRARVAAHGGVTFLCRDQATLEMVEGSLAPARAILAPDAAFALGAIPRPATADRDLVLLSRTDKERVGVRFGLAPVDGEDWLVDGGKIGLLDVRAVHAIAYRLGRASARPKRLAHDLRTPLGRLYDELADQRVRRGNAQLARGRVVVTDRLHAHILCLLMGIPHVVLDTGYGKLERFMTVWTGDAETVRFAQDPKEAGELARALLSEL